MVVATSPKELGIKLGKIRENRKGEPDYISQTGIALKVPKSQPTISLFEKGGVDITKWPSAQRYALLRAYDLSDDMIMRYSDEYGLDVFIPEMGSYAVEGPRAAYLGTVSAGLKGSGRPEQASYVSVPTNIANRYNLDDVFVLTATGDSMMCDDVRKTIPEGSEVYFHRKLRPENGEVVAVWLSNYDMGVLKVYRPSNGYTVLQSYNREHDPIVITEDNPGIVQGVYIGMSVPGPRSKR